MRFSFSYTIDVEVDRSQGKFASRDELEDQLREAINDALESADPGTLEGEAGGEYETTSWEVNEDEAVTA
jgi:hypothetical protein